jgi:uncharacterized SAM-binding protein YcdF (DUF218 family)
VSSALYIAYKLAKIFVYPLTWILVLLGLALLWSNGRRTRWLRVSLLLALGVTYGLSIPSVSRTLAWTLERQYAAPVEPRGEGRPYDAVVVLAGGVSRKGGLRVQDRLRPESLQRLLCGRDLMARGLAPMLVLSGGSADPFEKHTPESVIMEGILKSLGPTTWTIRTETVSRTTYENAVETKKVLGGLTRIALVTSAMHMPRSMAFFRRQGLDATAFPCEFLVGPPASGVMEYLPDVRYLEQSTLAINEWVGLGLYRLAGKTG